MFKAIDKWLVGYLRHVPVRPCAAIRPRHLLFCFCDHFEPFRGEASLHDARRSVKEWIAAYPAAVSSLRDADGRCPRHTFFYPQEEYDAEILDGLADLCRRGFGEVEIHLHHRHDTAEGLRQKLESFRDLLHRRHGLLGVERPKGELSGCHVAKLMTEEPKDSSSSATQQPDNPTTYSSVRYGFIHGNWALCNSRPDGDWCGVNEELSVLAETGCYADFTFPSAPSPTQPRMVNALYYARDRVGHPRGADTGRVVECDSLSVIGHTNNQEPITNNRAAGDLLLITGPLALNWSRRKWGLLPRLENAEISGTNPPTADRIRLWARQGIHVAGRSEWIFVKVHTHGCMPKNAKVVLGQTMRQAHETLAREFNDGRNWKLHYVTAREMCNLVKAAEAGAEGEPGRWMDFKVVWNS